MIHQYVEQRLLLARSSYVQAPKFVHQSNLLQFEKVHLITHGNDSYFLTAHELLIDNTDTPLIFNVIQVDQAIIE